MRCLSALAALAIVAVSAVGDACAQQTSVRLAEQDIKAGLLYNFLRYTEWPQPTASGAAMVVCIYGRDPFSGRLASMSGRTVNQRTIEVRVLREAAQANACSLLFVSADERSNWPRLRSQLGERGVLTVSDYDGFARSGGMIEFTRINNRIGVRVNIEAAEAANLSVQDRLLRLARVVRTAP
ncbi:YfiR family protein [Terricaulis silvestris]|uniref:DUF4154 domain-containing protein n=1 Tax=Terricaulis silvestris TaxID=2686094 RepID=A0A6I6MIB2_9CAUL|nr:YfiR family protein [Terricaulis silvestris]QGZ93421.1 hypothetical protein DSM104635_00231 [Terricaulis silvestris]